MVRERPHAFADLLRRYRRAAGLTQEELAERAGLSVRTLRKLESGASQTPCRDTLALLITALSLPEEHHTDLLAAARLQRLAPRADLPLQGNLPMPLTPILGREREESAAVHLLRRKDVRLLTLTGAPGIGKTRLALQVGADLQDVAPDGVFLVELAPISDPALVLSTILRTLDVREPGVALTTPLQS